MVTRMRSITVSRSIVETTHPMILSVQRKPMLYLTEDEGRELRRQLQLTLRPRVSAAGAIILLAGLFGIALVGITIGLFVTEVLG